MALKCWSTLLWNCSFVLPTYCSPQEHCSTQTAYSDLQVNILPILHGLSLNGELEVILLIPYLQDEHLKKPLRLVNQLLLVLTSGLLLTTRSLVLGALLYVIFGVRGNISPSMGSLNTRCQFFFSILWRLSFCLLQVRMSLGLLSF